MSPHLNANDTRVRYYTTLLPYLPTILGVKESIGASGQWVSAINTPCLSQDTHTPTHSQEPFKKSSRPKEPQVSGLGGNQSSLKWICMVAISSRLSALFIRPTSPRGTDPTYPVNETPRLLFFNFKVIFIMIKPPLIVCLELGLQISQKHTIEQYLPLS